MAPPQINLSKLRDETLNSGQDEEAVTVNTRALIDKILARYSGEHTTMRELIQNAADANATRVTIKFETLPSPSIPLPSTNNPSELLKHTVRNHTLKQLVVSNNGEAFKETDWSRLKRIAEGNPDETKIGAFGVGFYAVFSECENPFVMSGDQSMAFYWKNNSLVTKRARLPDGTSKDTNFVLEYRSATNKVPDLMSICQFLSTSLTFVGLERIDLWLDDWKLFSLQKKSAPAQSLDSPKDINAKTREGLMQLSGIDIQSAQMDASWMNIVGWTTTAERVAVQSNDSDGKPPSLRTFFSRWSTSGNNAAAKKAAQEEQATQHAITEDITGMSHATVFFRVSTVHIKSRVSSSFAAELERATKKPPPKTTKIAILISSHDETEASMSTVSGAASTRVAKAILGALPSKNGRIFIGFPTAQTTGLLAHISAPSIIPTVERENIDLNARYVRTWNEELLSVAGIACRIVFVNEMGRLQSSLGVKAIGTPLEEAQMVRAQPAALHILKQFGFQDSTPLGKVGNAIEEAFWTCTRRHTIEMMSTCGVLPSDQIRIASESLSFVKGLPLIPELIAKQASTWVLKLKEFGFLSDITNIDIKHELERQALTEAQLEEFLKWAGKKTRYLDMDTESILPLFAATIVNLAPDASGISQILELRKIDTFLNASRISPDLPLPPSTIPKRFTNGLTSADMESFGWSELQIVPWLRWVLEDTARGAVSEENNMFQSARFAQRVLGTLSRAWDNLSQSSKSSVIEMLANQTVIPTKLGMRKPADAYLPSVRLFEDLPILKLDGVKEKFLRALGVRKTIELKVIFDRLMSQSDAEGSSPTWNHVDLIKYLGSIWNDIPDSDIKQLKETPLCPAEVAGDSQRPTTQRFRVFELFEPNTELRELGLRIIQWPKAVLNPYMGEGKILKILGLRGHPTPEYLLSVIAEAGQTADIKTYEAGLRYFIDNHHLHNYGAVNPQSLRQRFLPVEGHEKLKIVKPDECFSNPSASVLGYHVLRTSLRFEAAKLGVREHPPIAECAQRLVLKPPKTDAEAKSLFTYFASRLSDISPKLGEALGVASIVPIRQKVSDSGTASKRAMLASPKNCFLGDDDEYGDIFDYVDFGEQPNMFLLKVGSKHEPSITELTHLLIQEPARILGSLKIEKYMNLLRKLFVNMAVLKKDKSLWREMKVAPFLLAYHEKPLDGKSEDASLLEVDEDEQSFLKEYSLRSAGGIVILNNLIDFAIFRKYLFAAPQEESLEELYTALGTPKVSDLIVKEPKLGQLSRDQRAATHLSELLVERSRLFLHDQPSSSIQHDAKWLEKNLAVATVTSASLRRTLRSHNQSHVERRSTGLVRSQDGQTKWTLAITSDYDVWEVSEEIVTLLMGSRKTQHVMIFEMFLTTSLHKLRSRGYDVDRVLQRKQREARAAETERQRKAEEEKKRAQEAQMALVAESAQSQQQQHHPDDIFEDPRDIQRNLDDKKLEVPGAFNETPERPRQGDSNQTDQTKGFLSSIRTGLGLDDSKTLSAGLDNFLRRGRNGTSSLEHQSQQQPEILPPPYSPYNPGALQKTGQRNAEHVSPPTSTNKNLQSAISASRAYTNSTLFSRPQTDLVKEVASYCDKKPGQSLELVGTTANGMLIYLDKTATDQADIANFKERNDVGLAAFEHVLLDCARIFGLPFKALHIYYDSKGETIAFNNSGAIFCNYRYFAQLHLAGMTDPTTSAQSETSALVYWWVTLCHELAHNLVSDHSSDHSYYTEHFVMEFFPAMANLQMHRAANASRALPNSGSSGRLSITGVERAFS